MSNVDKPFKKESDPVERTVEQLRSLSQTDPDRYQQLYIDLERAQIGENINNLDPAVKYLPQDVRAKVLRRLAGEAPASPEPEERTEPKSLLSYN